MLLESFWEELGKLDQEPTTGNGLLVTTNPKDLSTNQAHTQGCVLLNLKGDPLLFPEVVIPENKKKYYKTIEALFDNYNPNEEGQELITTEEKIEMKRFLDTIMETKVMQTTFRSLLQWKWITSEKVEDFKHLLHQIWFAMQGRKSKSSFEHIFIGEYSDEIGNVEKAKGLHYWYKYYWHDKSAGINTSKVRWNNRYPNFITLGYTANEGEAESYKPKGSFLLGCSPEYMIAVGTVLFLGTTQGHTQNEDFVLPYGGKNYKWKYICSTFSNYKLIVTMYPDGNAK